MKTMKEIAVDFLSLASKGRSREAFKLFVGQGFRHHNVYFKGDAESLMTAMEESAKKNPDRIFQVQRILQDGNLAAVHSRIRQKADDPGVAVIHIFRFESGKIVELWDFGQAVPKDTINENGMF